jgi:hypothetical protein
MSMPSVVTMPIMLSAVMLSVVMLNVVAPMLTKTATHRFSTLEPFVLVHHAQLASQQNGLSYSCRLGHIRLKQREQDRR